MRLWLDDVRDPPDPGWTWVKTVDEAIKLIETREVSHASLDHDLGQDEDGGQLPEGRTFVYWMAEHDVWPSEEVTIHSANPVGIDYMAGMIERYGPFDRVADTRFVRKS
jgi:hypothetical protein